jgi:hypothetical protein
MMQMTKTKGLEHLLFVTVRGLEHLLVVTATLQSFVATGMFQMIAVFLLNTHY